MTDSVLQWPALRHWEPLPETLSYKRAVWGKLRGALDDFGWIARSSDFDQTEVRIEHHLALGSEDELTQRAPFWRSFGGRYFALSSYPSRTVDAAGRRGLEKQFLEWDASGLPAALGAVLLLPQAARLGTDPSTGTQIGPAADKRDVTIHSSDCILARISETLPRVVEIGLSALRKTVTEESLAEFYGVLLSRRRPALLPGTDSAIPPEALAALLLPLTRSHADRISIAGWIVSRTFDPEAMRGAWDGIIWHSVPLEFRMQPDPRFLDEARAMARVLLNGEDPSSLTIRSTATSSNSSDVSSARSEVRALVEFAKSPDRWRRLSDPGTPIRLTLVERELLRSSIEELREELRALPGLSPELQEARRQHLRSKASLLKDAANALDSDLTGIDFTIC